MNPITEPAQFLNGGSSTAMLPPSLYRPEKDEHMGRRELDPLSVAFLKDMNMFLNY